jgi:hypothetical protein
MIPHPKFQLFKGQDDLFYFRLRARNGEILLQSEGYAARYSALNGIYVTKISAATGRFEQKTSKDGQYYFVVKARNGHTVAVSETYQSSRGAENAIQSVVSIVRSAPVEDTTIEAPTYPNPKFEIFRGQDNDFYFRLRAQNGEILLASEGYQSKQSANGAILSVRKLVDESVGYFSSDVSENGMYYFKLVAPNHEIIAVSELFNSEAARDGSILSVQNIAGSAPVEDTTISNLIELPPLFLEEEAALQAAVPIPENLTDEGESPVPNPKFQIFEGIDNEYYFRLRAQNGEIILQSENYTTKSGAQSGVGSVQRHSDDRKNYEVRKAENGSWYFVLRSDNKILPGQVIGISEMYETEEAAHNGIASVMAVAPTAPLEDETKGARVFDHPKYQIFRGKDGEFYFRLTARNGEILLSSEGYKVKSSAANGIASVRKNADEANRFERKVAANGEFYFVLKAANGEIIGESELFLTEESRENSLRSVMTIAPVAPVEDVTLLEALAV